MVLTYWWIENAEEPKVIFFADLHGNDPKPFINQGIKEGYRCLTLEMELETKRMLNGRLHRNDNTVRIGSFKGFPYEDPWTQRILSEGMEVD